MGELDGRVAIVTGGARGQGAAEATLFHDEGATVVVTDVLDEVNGEEPEAIEEAPEEIPKKEPVAAASPEIKVEVIEETPSVEIEVEPIAPEPAAEKVLAQAATEDSFEEKKEDKP